MKIDHHTPIRAKELTLNFIPKNKFWKQIWGLSHFLYFLHTCLCPTSHIKHIRKIIVDDVGIQIISYVKKLKPALQSRLCLLRRYFHSFCYLLDNRLTWMKWRWLQRNVRSRNTFTPSATLMRRGLKTKTKTRRVIFSGIFSRHAFSRWSLTDLSLCVFWSEIKFTECWSHKILPPSQILSFIARLAKQMRPASSGETLL